MNGLVLLALIGVLIGFGLSRLRRRMGIGVNWSFWVTTVAAVILAGLAMYAYSVKH